MRISSTPRGGGTTGPDVPGLAEALVGTQMVLIAALVVRGRRQRRRAVRPVTRVTGVALMAAGAGLGLAGATQLGEALTPSPLPRHGSHLRTDGVYALVRHPIYSGLLVAAAGRALSSGLGRHRLAAAALGALLTVKSGYEEQHLRARFPGYQAYAATTPRLVPRARVRRRTRKG